MRPRTERPIRRKMGRETPRTMTAVRATLQRLGRGRPAPAVVAAAAVLAARPAREGLAAPVGRLDRREREVRRDPLYETSRPLRFVGVVGRRPRTIRPRGRPGTGAHARRRGASPRAGARRGA